MVTIPRLKATWDVESDVQNECSQLLKVNLIFLKFASFGGETVMGGGKAIMPEPNPYFDQSQFKISKLE